MNVMNGIFLENGFHFASNDTGCPLFHINLKPIIFLVLGSKLTSEESVIDDHLFLTAH